MSPIDLCNAPGQQDTGPEDLNRRLVEHGIRPSPQRVAIWDHVLHAGGHPTADEVYLALSAPMPALSRATVYHTLDALARSGLLRAVAGLDGRLRYDGDTANHGHFCCDRCGVLVDFAADLSELAPPALEGYLIRERHVTFRGLCPNCLSRAATGT
jgi:Fur family peroxide stress response transcriptional regulator